MPVSIRVRLTLWYVLLLAIVLAVFGGAVFLSLRQVLYSNLDASIQSSADAILGTIQLEEEGGQFPSIPRPADDSDDDIEQYVRVFDISKKLVFDSTGSNEHLFVDSPALSRALAGESRIRRFEVDDDPMRAGTFPIVRDGVAVGVLEVGRSEEDAADTLSTLLLILGVAYLATLVLASFGGVWLAGQALSPIDDLTRLARRISAEDLGQRLDLRLPDDEVGRLARTFDEMIGRLDDSFRRQRRFTADASHELRTPLTIIKGQIEVSLQSAREPDAYRQVLEAVNEEVDRLVRLTGSLLTLARADAGQIPMAFESVNLAALVAGAVEQLGPMSSQREVELRHAPGADVNVWADEDLLLQLLLNLLDNAIKHTPSGGRVSAGWSSSGEQAELWVRDTGVGIPVEHLPHIFDRFYRVDEARSRAEGGVGLGLAISRWIAETHGGAISVESASGEGSTFTVQLPTVH
jgi:heavy metal sensor kinase